MEQNNGKQSFIDTEQNKRITWLEQHYSNFNSELGSVKADVKWLKWWMKMMIGSQIAIILGLLKLLFY